VIRRVAAWSAAVVVTPTLASACPVCFGASDAPMVQGSSMGILALLVVTVAMLSAFGAFFRTLARRAARASEPHDGLMPHGQPEGTTPR
jgi:hypothetical protein